MKFKIINNELTGFNEGAPFYFHRTIIKNIYCQNIII